MDQGRQAGSALDPVVVSQIRRQRGALAIERVSVQPVAAARAAEVNRRLVAEELAATVGQDGGGLIKNARYCWLLLAEGHLTSGCLARWWGGPMLCRCPAGSTPIAVAKSVAEGRGAE